MRGATSEDGAGCPQNEILYPSLGMCLASQAEPEYKSALLGG
jgi:hypothetical protein